jgi:hypothetical protein
MRGSRCLLNCKEIAVRFAKKGDMLRLELPVINVPRSKLELHDGITVRSFRDGRAGEALALGNIMRC